MHEWSEITARLTADREALPWSNRRDLARAAGDLFLQQGQAQTGHALAELLASDPKWEVRQAVAELLPLMPDDLFVRLTATLSEDPNSFVRGAAERALDRRRRGEREEARKKRGVDQVQADFEVIERQHGKLAAERARRLSDRRYALMVGATVHDLRGALTPLKARVASLISQAAAGTLDPSALGARLEKLRARLDYLERLVDDMQVMSQELPVERPLARVADLLTEAKAMAIENLQASGCDLQVIQWRFQVPDGASVKVARHQIILAMANILRNAVESFEDDNGQLRSGTIDVVTEVADGGVRIGVADDGMGISPNDLRELREFIPGRTSKPQGTGFGLPIARRYVQAHGGTLAIDSTENNGTTVTIELPLESPEEEADDA